VKKKYIEPNAGKCNMQSSSLVTSISNDSRTIDLSKSNGFNHNKNNLINDYQPKENNYNLNQDKKSIKINLNKQNSDI